MPALPNNVLWSMMTRKSMCPRVACLLNVFEAVASRNNNLERRRSVACKFGQAGSSVRHRLVQLQIRIPAPHRKEVLGGKWGSRHNNKKQINCS